MTADAPPPQPPPADWLETLTDEQLVDLASRAAAIVRRRLDERRAAGADA